VDIKNYQKQPVKPLTFEEWKGNLAPSFSDETMKSMQRLHGLDYKKEFDRMLENEYNEYLDNLNGNWLLR
jgi:preprotein translocase subunit Sec63